LSARYLDSSAFVKFVVDEDESAVLRDRFSGQGMRFVSSALLRTEAMRAVRHASPETIAAMRDALRRVDLVGLDDRILDAAAGLDPAVMRTLDAIHLATAMALGDDLIAIVSYDERMLKAARVLGLPTESPR